MNGNARKYTLEPSVRALLIDMGLSPANVLRSAGLAADLLSRGQVRLAEPQFFALWRAIEEEIDDPDFPLLIGELFSPELFSAPTFSALISPDLNTAAVRVATYKKLIGPMRIEVEVGDDETAIRYHWPAGSVPPASLMLTENLFWVALARSATRRRIEPLRLTVLEPPANMSPYVEYLGVPVTRASEQKIVFSAADASRGFLTTDDSLWAMFEPELRRRLAELAIDATASERVRAVLLELLPVGRTTMTEVAGELAMSSRTLHRRLKAEGTTFQQVLDSTREDLARHYLKDPTLSAQAITFLLGYEEPSSFYRAFNSWTGATPEKVRSEAVPV